MMTLAARPRVERSFLLACPLFQRIVIAAAYERTAKRGVKLVF